MKNTVFYLFIITLTLVAGCNTVGGTGGTLFGGRETTQTTAVKPVDNRQFNESRTDTRLAGAEAAIADMRAEIEELNSALNKAYAKAERDTRSANSDTRAEIAALRGELATLRAKVDALPAAISKLIDEREKKIIAYTDSSVKAAETRITNANRRPVNTTTTTSGGQFTQAYEHVVESGQTLSEIAQAYSQQTGTRITVNDILSANNIPDASKLKIGQKILIPKK
ncbi:MAG: LysM peptidoglycan-binding domain-containing protein [Kiritimatiellaeota bacterium]|nr:LysM peptidoglycan-binding domain-containing protein [Kiritimatiellota bacterium]